MSEWVKTTLSNYIEIINGFAFKSKNFLDKQKDNSLPIIKIKNVANGDVNLNSVQYHEYNTNLSKYLIENEDILIALTGNHPQALTQVVGQTSKYKLKNKALLNQRVAKVIAKDNFCHVFLYYFLKDEWTHEYLANQSSGSANQANISKKDIEALPISLPPLKEQKVIAEVLSSLDDKIDLLHCQNKTLEALAQTLFRQWFIEEAKDEWEVGILEDILTVKGGTTPSTKNDEYWNGNICWSTPKDLSSNSDMYLFDTARKITESGLVKISSGLLPKGTILLSSRAPVGYLAIAEVPLAINQGYIAILDDKGFSKYFIFLWLKLNMEYVISNANGSTFLEISKTVFKSLEIIKPPKDLREKFDDIVIDNFKKIKANSKQIKILENLRDTLLPKLMSGEVRVKYGE